MDGGTRPVDAAPDAPSCGPRIDAGASTDAKRLSLDFAVPVSLDVIDHHKNGLLQALSVQDVTGDQIPDLVTTVNRDSGASPPWVQLNRGIGDGRFKVPEVLWTGPPGFAGQVLVADTNSDSHPDIVFYDDSGSVTSSMCCSVSRGDGSFDLPVLLPDDGLGHLRPRLADVNRDGRLDLVYGETVGLKQYVVVVLNHSGR